MKPPTKKGQRKVEIVKCPTCEGSETVLYGDCNRGCCGNMTQKVCYTCKGIGYVKRKYKAVLVWERV